MRKSLAPILPNSLINLIGSYNIKEDFHPEEIKYSREYFINLIYNTVSNNFNDIYCNNVTYHRGKYAKIRNHICPGFYCNCHGEDTIFAWYYTCEKCESYDVIYNLISYYLVILFLNLMIFFMAYFMKNSSLGYLYDSPELWKDFKENCFSIDVILFALPLVVFFGPIF